MTEQLQRFINLLKGIFELDKSDLDFGIYRIMNIRKAEIERFLTEGLPRKVQEALAPFARNTGEIEKEIASIEKQCEEFGIEVMQSKKAERYAELKKQLALGVDLSGLEADVYSNLYSFFNRYYEEGDFISKRRYKEGVYAIPYEGEEVKLYWANQDQYYIKTSENFKDYTFVAGGYDIHFRLVDATTEQNNNKELADSKRVFMLFEENDEQPELKTFEFDAEKHELIIRFVFDIPPDKKFNYAEDNAKKIHSWIISDCNQLMTTLLVDVSRDPKKKQTLIEKHLAAYTAKNTFDYFIHKDLRGFLSRELDFYIKNEVIHLDDIDTTDEKSADTWLAKVRAIKRVGRILIDFLAQIEDFQKKLWLKKKFVISTNWCITLDRIDEKFYPEIAINEKQRQEWVKLYSIQEITASSGKTEKDGNYINEKGQLDIVKRRIPLRKFAYSVPLHVGFLKENQFMMVDTKFFDEKFKEKLLASLMALDESCDGILVNSENYQALNLLKENYKERIECVYIDPPYNTELDRNTGKFIYKDNYAFSTWNALFYDRALSCHALMNPRGVFWTSLDDNEMPALRFIMDGIFSAKNFISTVAWQLRDSVSSDHRISLNHNYNVLYGKDCFQCDFGGLPIDAGDYVNPDNDSRGPWKTVPLDANKPGGDTKYGIENPNTGKIYYPPSNRSWAINQASYNELLIDNRISFGVKGDSAPKKKLFYKERMARGDVSTPISIWTDIETTQSGTEQIIALFGEKKFPYPKPLELLKRIIQISQTKLQFTVLDYFAGSGTTAHAVISLNQTDGGKRKYILVEMGEHFDNVLKPRIQKVVYAQNWKVGKPQPISSIKGKHFIEERKVTLKNKEREQLDFLEFETRYLGTQVEDNPEWIEGNPFKGISHCFKYMTLESYEDTLSNISLLPDEESNQMTMKFGDEYLIKYMLDLEARGSILNLEAFRDPFDYQLNVTEKNETKRVTVDVVETFNYLIGLTVTHMSARKIFRATPDREGEYEGAVKLALDDNGTYCFRQVEGKLPDGRRTLVIWRNLTDNLAESNAALDAYFTRNRINPADREYDVIYVNGDNNLENLRTDHERWKVRLIEIEFKQKMFEEA